MKMTALIENTTSDQRLIKEHGLSLYFELDGEKYLFDTGQSNAFIHNAGKLGIDLTDIDYVIISHNHYDHIGGLKSFLLINSKAEIYIKRAAFEAEYVRLGIKKKVLSLGKDSFMSDRFIYVDDDLRLNDKVTLMSVIRPDSRYISRDNLMYMSLENRYVRDTFAHELFAVIDDNALTVIDGCSHNGIVNVIMKVKEAYGKPIDYLIGGFHTMGRFGLNTLNCNQEYINSMIECIARHCDNIYTGHCTGIKAYNLMASVLKDRINYLDTGRSIDIA